jgi:hypothetical protein
MNLKNIEMEPIASIEVGEQMTPKRNGTIGGPKKLSLNFLEEVGTNVNLKKR